ncbi:uncharacterized protein LOC110825736 isoform X2 [Carica papaya]|nr:uncharacterized protein LOC110825736 isoform X2 [Carica papaya]XP_021911923.1 uncharacterized protein LOC110825736 isoform X2 [Carica papaya]
MGTKLDYSIFNPLARSSTSVVFVNDWDFLHTSSSSSGPIKENKYKFKSVAGHHYNSMDKLLEKHNMESIRKTMQLHEDIFKHQVRELHRLYSVQKMLMDEVKREIKQNRYWISSTGIDNTNQCHQYSSSTSQGVAGFGYSFTIEGLRDHHHHHHHHHPISSRERSTGSCSGPDTMRVMTRGFDLERIPTQDQEDVISTLDQDYSRPSQKTEKTSINAGSDEDSEIELTLSIGGSSTSKINRLSSSSSSKRYNQLNEKELSIRPELENSSVSFKSDRGDSSTGPNTPISSSSTTFDQERKRPHWLFQGLSINRT